MNGTLKVVLKLPPKAGLCADSNSQQIDKDLGGHRKKKRKLEGDKSGRASSGDGNFLGAVPAGGAGIAGRQGATSQGIANGRAGAEQSKPRISIKLPSFKSVGANNAGPPQPPRPWQTVPSHSVSGLQQKSLPVVRIPGSLLQTGKKRKAESKEAIRPSEVRQVPGLKKTEASFGLKTPGKELRPGTAHRRPGSSVSGRAGSESAGADASGVEIGSGPSGPRTGGAQPGPSTDSAVKKKDMQRVIDRLQKKDAYNIFRSPVTEEMAPGYYSVIKKGMDFTTMWEKFNRGEYTTWNCLKEDMTLMFTNAMTYNTPDTVYHKQAKSLLDLANKLLELASQGIMDFRGRVASLSRQHNAQIAAEQAQERERARLEARQQKAAARAAKLAEQRALAGMMVGDDDEGDGDGEGGRPRIGPLRRPANADENLRQTYPHRNHHGALSLHAMAFGSSAEGIVFAHGRPVLRPLPTGPIQLTAYSESLNRFAEKMGGKVGSMVLAATKQTDPKMHVLPLAPPPSAPHQLSANSQLRTGSSAAQNVAPAVAAAQLRAKQGLAAGQTQQTAAAVPLQVAAVTSQPPAAALPQRVTPAGWPMLPPRAAAPPIATFPTAGAIPALFGNVSALAQQLGLNSGSNTSLVGNVSNVAQRNATTASAPASSTPQVANPAAARLADILGPSGLMRSSATATGLQQNPAGKALWNTLQQQQQQIQQYAATQAARTTAPGTVASGSGAAAAQQPAAFGSSLSHLPFIAGHLGAGSTSHIAAAQTYQANLVAALAYQASARAVGTAAPAQTHQHPPSAPAGVPAGNSVPSFHQQQHQNPSGQQQQYTPPASQPNTYASMGFAMPQASSSTVGTSMPPTSRLTLPLGTLPPSRIPHGSGAQPLPAQPLLANFGGSGHGGAMQEPGIGAGALPVQQVANLPQSWAPAQAQFQPAIAEPQQWVSDAGNAGDDVGEEDMLFDFDPEMFA